MSKLIRIRYVDGRTIEVEEGTSVLEGSVRYGVDHMHACGGAARCTTCRIEVLDGLEHCPAPNERERDVSAINGICSPVRLACQLRPTGDITVRVLMQEHREEPTLRTEGDARELQVAVLFADIRGFTTFAENRLPFDVLHVLNRYFDRMGTIVELHGGRVMSFQGDGMMCLFGLAGDAQGAAVSAAETSLSMLEAAGVQAAYCADHFEFELAIGIGIDFGRAVIGEVGYYRNSQLNAIGDVVNTAARVQDFTKETGCAVLATKAVRDRVRERFRFGREFSVEMRGKRGQHRLYELVGDR